MTRGLWSVGKQRKQTWNWVIAFHYTTSNNKEKKQNASCLWFWKVSLFRIYLCFWKTWESDNYLYFSHSTNSKTRKKTDDCFFIHCYWYDNRVWNAATIWDSQTLSTYQVPCFWWFRFVCAVWANGKKVKFNPFLICTIVLLFSQLVCIHGKSETGYSKIR